MVHSIGTERESVHEGRRKKNNRRVIRYDTAGEEERRIKGMRRNNDVKSIFERVECTVPRIMSSMHLFAFELFLNGCLRSDHVKEANLDTSVLN